MAFDRSAAHDNREIGEELVSVIIPVYNAAPYVDATLRSVRAQTHKNLEIFVIDDGSTDASPSIIAKHRHDPRVRYIRQRNQGVAIARNTGLELARGRYFAPIDADDLWAPHKISTQLAAARENPERIGLVYSWYITIDGNDRILDCIDRTNATGDVKFPLARKNIVGNGSSPLILKDAAMAVGGYDSSLRQRGAEGCEDYKLYFQIAEAYDFKLVPDYLMAYRLHGSSMSRRDQMMRSRAIVTAEITRRHPELVSFLRLGKARAHRYALTRNLRAGAFRASAAALYDMLKGEHIYAIKELGICVADNVGALIPFRSRRQPENATRFARGTILLGFGGDEETSHAAGAAANA